MKQIYFKIGDKVVIYQDPITQYKTEGAAILIRFAGKSDYPPFLEDWEVKFEGDKDYHGTFIRTIKP